MCQYLIFTQQLLLLFWVSIESLIETKKWMYLFIPAPISFLYEGNEAEDIKKRW